MLNVGFPFQIVCPKRIGFVKVKKKKAAANGSGIFEVRTDLRDSLRSAWINWQLAGKGVTILVPVLLRVS